MVPALLVATLAAIAVDRVGGRRARLVAAVSLVIIILDGPSRVFRFDAADSGLLAAIPRAATVLHLPPFDPGHFSGSVYAFVTTRIAGPMPNGYNPFVTPAARDAQQKTRALGNPPPDPCRWRALIRSMRIEYVAVHLDLYGPYALQWPANGQSLVAALDAMPGFTRLDAPPPVAIYRVTPDLILCRDSP